MTDKVFCLMGPTATGKTDLACELASRFPIEIISVDSALVYQDMNIGTAKPNTKVLREVPHHLIDIRTPVETYSAASFCEDVVQLVREIKLRQRIPLLVGGTMMYFRALQVGLNALPEANLAVRQVLQDEMLTRGLGGMYAWLCDVDPLTANRLHAHDSQRILRALEIYVLTGKAMSSCLDEQAQAPKLSFTNLALFPQDRSWLHRRIAERFEGMLTLGFLNEVEFLKANWPITRAMPSMRCVGYRQALDYLEGITDYKTFVAQGIAATRQLAKRQLTWLRRWPDIVFVEPNDSQIAQKLLSYFEKHMT